MTPTITPVPGAITVEMETEDDDGGLVYAVHVYRSRAEIDALIAELVAARVEAWPVAGYDGDADSFEVMEETL